MAAPAQTSADGLLDLPNNAVDLVLGKKIGSGGFGAVYKGKLNGQAVAVKVMQVKDGMRAPAQDRWNPFYEEIQNLQGLDHRNVVGFKGVCRVTSAEIDVPADCLALMQEYLGGGPLSHVVCRQMASPTGKLYSLKDALNWCLDLARALEYLHTRAPALIHRDVKLSNVLLSEKVDGRRVAKLSDFGLCKRLKDDTSALLRSSEYGPLSSRHRQVFFYPTAEVSSAVMSRLADSSRADPCTGGLGGRAQPREGPRSTALPMPGRAEKLATTQEHAGEFDTFEVTDTVEDRAPSKALCQSASFSNMSMDSNSASFLRTDTRSMTSMYSEASCATLGSGDLPELMSDALAVVYNLTGQTGSYMYMAPEVFVDEPYNPKIDVFSFAIVMYELLGRCMLVFTELQGAADESIMKLYAAKVASGYRPPRAKPIPDNCWDVITRCWAQDPLDRPSMDEVVEELEDLVAQAQQGKLKSGKSTSKPVSPAAAQRAASQHSVHSNAPSTIARSSSAGDPEPQPAVDGCKCVIC